MDGLSNLQSIFQTIFAILSVLKLSLIIIIRLSFLFIKKKNTIMFNFTIFRFVIFKLNKSFDSAFYEHFLVENQSESRNSWTVITFVRH